MLQAVQIWVSYDFGRKRKTLIIVKNSVRIVARHILNINHLTPIIGKIFF